ncbi:MAG TPA: hypothetical protein VEX13_10800 [Chloroflexia bacterium]|nr:hypothetical protein [Chloroflexia bacterium]
MDELFITVIVPAIVGALAGFVSAAAKNALDARSKIDEQLRQTRITLYKVLWQKTKLLPKWPRATNVTYEDLAQLSEELRDWYFDNGGIYLSTAARRAYGNVQDALAEVTRDITRDKAVKPLDSKEYNAVQVECSKLRTELTKDLLSRRRTFVV